MDDGIDDSGDGIPETWAEVPLSSMPDAACRGCDGDGWVIAAYAAEVGGRRGTMAKQQVCPVCRDQKKPGRVSMAAGPGAKLRRVDRVAFPWDELPTGRP